MKEKRHRITKVSREVSIRPKGLPEKTTKVGIRWECVDCGRSFRQKRKFNQIDCQEPNYEIV